MVSILLTVIFGLGIGYFATQNTAPVALRVGDFIWPDVPLYVVAVGSLLLGLFIAWIFYFARTLSASLTIFGKDREMSRSRRTVGNLEHRIHELEVTNAQLRAERPSEHHADHLVT
ncbi:MAG TPA: LapA family protein [Candidatus Binatia bacterium]|jgi:uncharacterized integral membrane protein